MATMFQRQNVQGGLVSTVRDGYKYKLNKEQKQALDDLVKQKTSLQMDYIDFPAKHAEWQNYASTQATVDKQNRMYYMALLGICAVPLRRGVNVHSVATCIGMYAGICALNPNFRKNIKGIVREAMLPYYDQVHDMFPNSRFAKLIDKVLPNKEQVLIDRNYGRLPLTPETAALQRLGWIEKAYKDMRKPGNDPNEVMHKFNDACRALDDLCAKDGVSKEDVSEKMQSYIMMRVQENPENERYYAEFDNGRCSLSTQNVYAENADGTVEVRKVAQPTVDPMTGKRVYCYDAHSSNGIYTGDFTPRMPSDMQHHYRRVNEMCRDYVDTVETLNDLNSEFTKEDINFLYRDTVEFAKFDDDYDCNNEFRSEDWYHSIHNESRSDYVARQYAVVCGDVSRSAVASWIVNHQNDMTKVSEENAKLYADELRNYDKAKADYATSDGTGFNTAEEFVKPFNIEDDDDFSYMAKFVKASESVYNGTYVDTDVEVDTEYSEPKHSTYKAPISDKERWANAKPVDEDSFVVGGEDYTAQTSGFDYSKTAETSEPKYTHYKGSLGDFDYDEREFQLGTVTNYDGKQCDYLAYIGRATEGKDIKIPNGINSTRFMFANNAEIKSGPDIPTSVADCSYMFANSSVQVPSYIPNGVVNATGMYRECKDLNTAPVVPESVKFTDDMFTGCKRSVEQTGLYQAEHRGSEYTDQQAFEDAVYMHGTDYMDYGPGGPFGP